MWVVRDRINQICARRGPGVLYGIPPLSGADCHDAPPLHIDSQAFKLESYLE